MLFDKLTIRARFAILLTLFFLGFLSLSTLRLLENISSFKEIERLRTLADASLAASDLVHELQKERGFATLLFSSHGKQMRSELEHQYHFTDERASALRHALEAVWSSDAAQDAKGVWGRAEQRLERLDDARRTLSLSDMSTLAPLKYYSDAISDLLTAVGKLADVSSVHELSRLTYVFVNLAHARERAGLERALLGGAFTRSHLSPADFARMVTLIAEQQTFTEVALANADEENRGVYANRTDDPAILEVERLRAAVLEQAGVTGLDVDPVRWYDRASVRIERLKAVGDHIAEDIVTAAGRTYTQTWGDLMLSLGATLLGLAITSLFSFLTVHSILGQLTTLEQTITHIEQRSDLTARVPVHSEDEVGRTARAFNHMLDAFAQVVRHIASAAAQLSCAADELSEVTEQSHTQMQRQRREADQVAVAMNQMVATVQDVSRSTSQAAQAAQQADDAGIAGGDVVEQATQAMDLLAAEVSLAASVIRQQHEESKRVERVLDVIRGIAEQTNLLALNAAIEAARAGDLGRGFAVVANEVRTLAARTQQSTLEIQHMVEALQRGAEEAVTVMDRALGKTASASERVQGAATALAGIAGDLITIRDMNGRIATATEEQGAVAEEVNRNVSRMSVAIEHEAQGSEQVAEASRHIALLSVELHTLVARFRVAPV